ncbi:MAG: septal ring lytic transglycosylase RlpA family protein [Methyloceanibacter sp.]
MPLFLVRLRMAARLVLALGLGAAVASGLTCCGSGGRGAKLGERVIPLGQPVPKGGGVYRVGEPYEIAGTWYYPREEKSYNRVGKASWYGELFHGRRTANGEIYDMDRLSAAHPTLPLPIYARVTNLNNGRSVVVRVNDRGPYANDRIIDLSRRSADVLGFRGNGVATVRVQYLGRAPLSGDDSYERRYLASQGFAQVAEKGKPKRAAEPRIVSLGEEVEAYGMGRGQQTASVRANKGAFRLGTPARTEVKASAETTGAIATAIPRGALVIQAGAFKVKENADKARTTLGQLGTVEVAEIDMKGEPFYRVRVGPFRDRKGAKAALAEATEAGFQGAKIVKAD